MNFESATRLTARKLIYIDFQLLIRYIVICYRYINKCQPDIFLTKFRTFNNYIVRLRAGLKCLILIFVIAGIPLLFQIL